MVTLAPALPPLMHETTVSWTGRLARKHANMNCAAFLSMMEISRKNVMETTEYCVERLTELTGIDPQRIKNCGVQCNGDRVFEHRREKFGIRFALKTHTTYCPACLLNDGMLNSRSDGLRVGRTGWIFSPVRTCPEHGIELVRRKNLSFSEQFQDMYLVAPDDRDLEIQAQNAAQRAVSGLQRYIMDRFEHVRGPAWLDEQQVDQASRACEILGVCVIFGAHTDLDELTQSHWDEAGAAGFEAAAFGPSGVCDALDRIAEKSLNSKIGGGPQATFGRLYQWLQFNKTKQDRGPIRHIMREHILETWPIEAGTKLFGEIVPERRRHSVNSLAKKTGQHPKTLHRALVRSNVLPKDNYKKGDPRESFSAHAGERLARRMHLSVSIVKVPEYLNCNRTQAQMLVKHGILPQIVSGSDWVGGILTNVAIEDLDAFLNRFRSCGTFVSAPSEGMVNVIDASEIARHPAIDIVRLVLDGRLRRVEVLPASLKFRSVLVEPAEVRSAITSQYEKIGLTAHEAAKRLGISPTGMSHLRTKTDRNGLPFLSALEIKNTRGTIRYRYTEEEVARFQAKHAKLMVLATEAGVTSKVMAQRLSGIDIHPIIRRELLNAAVYRRSDL